MRTIQNWSGGKDSTASIILEHIHGLPPSTIIFSEVMFDKKRGISGELPEHMEWVHNTAIPLFKSWGHEVKILHADKDYLDLFYHKPTRSKTVDHRNKLNWFCPSATIRENAHVKQFHPELWAELERLSHTKNLISYGFKYGATFVEVDAKVDKFIENDQLKRAQITLDEVTI